MNAQYLDLLTKACDEIVSAKEAIANAESKIAYIREQIQQITAAQAQKAGESTLGAQSQNTTTPKSLSDIPQPRASRVKEILAGGVSKAQELAQQNLQVSQQSFENTQKVTNLENGDVSKFEETPKNLRDITITSLEIAELTGKQHLHIMRDIRDILGELGDVSKFGYIYKDTYGREQNCYRLPKREALILVSGYNVKLRAKIIDRLEYLENQILDKMLVAPAQAKEVFNLTYETLCRDAILKVVKDSEVQHNAKAKGIKEYTITEKMKKGKVYTDCEVGIEWDKYIPPTKPIITKGYLPKEQLKQESLANVESKSKIRKR